MLVGCGRVEAMLEDEDACEDLKSTARRKIELQAWDSADDAIAEGKRECASMSEAFEKLEDELEDERKGRKKDEGKNPRKATRGDCLRLAEHTIDLTLKEQKGLPEAALKAAKSEAMKHSENVVAECVGKIDREQIACAMKAESIAEMKRCGP